MLGRTIPHGNRSAYLFTSCSAKCFVKVYVLGCSPRMLACFSLSSSSLLSDTNLMISSALAGAGYKISSHSTKNEFTYALDTWTIALKLRILLHRFITRRVPNKFVFTVGRNDSWKSSVAAEWITTFTLSTSV